MHEGLQKVSRMRERVGITRLSVVVAAAIGFGSPASDGAVAADARKLSGVQIRARLVGMQLTDKVHYRFVYDPDGTLRSYSMGARRSEGGRSKRTNCACGLVRTMTAATR